MNTGRGRLLDAGGGHVSYILRMPRIPTNAERTSAPTFREHVFLPERLRELLRQRLATGVLQVQAPAGCGKTAIVLQFLLDRGDDPRWYTCGADDADAAHLLAGLVRAMGGAASDAGQTTLAALTSREAGQSYRAALKPFVEGLTGGGPQGALVIDDADAIAGFPEAVNSLDHVISACSPWFEIVVISRAELALGSQAKRLLEGHAARVMAEDLLFRTDEIGGFARAAFGVALTPEECERLYRATGGWAIALRLALRLHGLGSTVTSDEHAHFTPEARADLFRYLAAEVLSRVDARIERFLRMTAVIETLDPAVCARLTGEARAAELLQSLAGAGLPVMKSGWSSYRCHSLLREYFLAQMTEDDTRAAHVDAGKAYQASGASGLAFSHFVVAGETARALALADRPGGELFREGRGRALVEIMKAASPDERAEHYSALYWAAFTASRMFDWDWAAAAFEEVASVAAGRGDARTAREALRTLAYMYNVWGRFSLAADAAGRLVGAMPEGDVAARAAAVLGHSVPGMTGSGQFRAAIALIHQRLPDLALEPRADPDAEAFARAIAAVTLARDGDFAMARAQLALAEGLLPACTDDVVRTQVPWVKAMVAFLACDLAAAEAATHETETLALGVGDLQRTLECHALRATVRLQLGRLEEAERGFKDVEALRAGVTNFWVAVLAMLSRPRRLLLAGDTAGALAASEANHAVAAGAGEMWFVCFTRLEVIYCRMINHDRASAVAASALALEEARALNADLLLYGANLMLAASQDERDTEALAEALRIADERDYRFVMPYGARLPELDAALWRALGSERHLRAAVLLTGMAPAAAAALASVAGELDEAASLRAVETLAGWGSAGRDGLRAMAGSRHDSAARAARAALDALARANPYGLSKREVEVLALLREGLRTKQIAAKLTLTPATVSTHIQHIMVKTGTSSRAELVALAFREGPPAS